MHLCKYSLRWMLRISDFIVYLLLLNKKGPKKVTGIIKHLTNVKEGKHAYIKQLGKSYHNAGSCELFFLK